VALQDPARLEAGLSNARLEAGLASARLYRSLGEWQAGAEVLDRLAEAGCGDPPALAAVSYQLGRLRAGPLEDVPGAIDAYRRALEWHPPLAEARLALADLLGHCAEHRAEALALHRTILAESPCRAISLRTVVRLAGARSPAAEAAGLTVLRALGAASPDERARASAVVTPHAEPSLADPLFETARELVRAAAAEIGQALLAASGGFEPASEDPVGRFRARVAACEAELSAPGLASLAHEELARLVAAVARLAVEGDPATGVGSALATALGRRTRRRLERVLQDRSATPRAIESIDFAAWRAELRALAAGEALRRTGETLRTALLALLADEPGRCPAPEADLSPLVERCPEAQALVRRIVLGCAMPS
jgi:tetratricopeptide (TPR) repeat protein